MDPTDTWLLVPTERHVEALAASGTSATTLRKLVSELAAEHAPKLSPTTPETTRLLSAELLGCTVGQAKAFDDALGRLRRAGTRLDSLRAARMPRAARFVDFMVRANQRLAELGLRDEREAGWLAARRLGNAESLSQAAGAGRAVVRGLTRWDPSTLAVLEALHAALRKRGGEGVCLELPDHGVAPLSTSVQTLAAELEARWAHENDHPSLSFEPSRALEASRVRLIEASDPGSEARAAARAVLDALARGVALDRIAVVPVDLSEAFLEPLRFEFTRARIPFVEPRGRPVIAAPRAHAALELLRLARGPLVRDGLVDVLRVPGLRFERWFGDTRAAEIAHELGKLPLRVERTSGDLVSELELRFAGASLDASAENPLDRLRDGLTRFLAELSRLGSDATRQQHARRFDAFFEELGLLRSSPAEVSRALLREKQGGVELLQSLGHDAIAAASVKSASERAVAAAAALGRSGESVRLETWIEELELSLEGVAPSRGAARAAAVRIARPDDVAFMDLGLVVLSRASDARLDRPVAFDPTLGPELEGKLPPRERPPGSALDHHFLWLSVGSALARAESVVITWARRDESATTLLPSRLARALSPSAPIEREPASPLSPAARRAAARKPVSPNAAERTRVDLSRAAFYANPESVPDALNGEAGDLRAFFGSESGRPVAITSVERGLRCAFLAFSGQVLRASRTDPVGDAIGARERGSLLHEALASALEASAGTRENGSSEEFVSVGVAAAARLLERKGQSPLRRVGLQSTLADVRAVLRLLARKDDGLDFRYAEHAFGEGTSWPSHRIGVFPTSGRIDRIDASADTQRIRVIDYKTRTPTKADEALLLQPWLYAQKAARELGAREVEFCFVGVDGRNPSERVVYRGSVDGEPIVEAERRTLSMLTALSDGHVAARPSSSAFCPRCDARDICRRPLSSPEGPEE